MLPPAIVEAAPAGPALLRAVFADGAVRLFDVGPYLGSSFFAPLSEPAYLARVRVAGGTVVWPEGQDFDRGTVYALGTPVEPGAHARTQAA